MHILRWLMKHPIMLAWLLAIVAILLNFSMVGKNSEDEHAQVAQEAATTEHGQAAETHGEAPAVQAGAEQVPAAVEAEQVAAQTAAPAGLEQAAVGSAPAAPVPPVAPAVPTAPVAPVAGTTAQGAAPAQNAVASAPVQTSEADLLRAAREAYWSNELDSAVGFYTSLLEQKPDSLEYKGELANVFWKQGNAHEAAKLFTEIAPKLADQGRVTEAFNMKLYVDMVDPELAKQIDAALK